MIVCNTIAELKEKIQQQKSQNRVIGFVPTMGALHQGHLSLVEASNKACDYTVASIFVNPTQFNNSEDLEKYPRDENRDLQLLEKMDCDCVFIPSVKEVYPEKDSRIFDFDGLDLLMEGAFRPGHFNGVAQVVSKLFYMVEPNKAYFGIKDFQQVSIVSKMVEKLEMKIEIIACPIVREKNGLAMSSRNERLNPKERERSSIISKALFEAKKEKENKTVSETKEQVIRTINDDNLFDVEYFEIVNMKTLKPINEWDNSETQVGCVAVNVGKVRLIDNISF